MHHLTTTTLSTFEIAFKTQPCLLHLPFRAGIFFVLAHRDCNDRQLR